MRVLLRAAGLLFAIAILLAARDIRVAEIEHAVRAEMARKGIPGLSAAVVADRRLCWSAGFGMADVENDVRAKASTVYRLASISKSITAVAAMQLVEQGLLDLDTPIDRYLPDFPAKPWPITSRQLLGHLAGIRHYRTIAEVYSTRHYAKMTEALRLFTNDALITEPGTHYLYSTYGYSLMGAVIEAAAHQDFIAYLTEHIFDPAGMDRAQVDDVGAVIPGRAHGYYRLPDGSLRNSGLADTSNKIPGGGLVGSAVDLGHFIVALQNGTLLRTSTLDEMFTVQTTRDGRPTGYGLGWHIKTPKDGPMEVYHDGAQPQVSTLLFMIPSKGFGLALLANLEGVDLYRLARQILDLALP